MLKVFLISSGVFPAMSGRGELAHAIVHLGKTKGLIKAARRRVKA